MGKGQFDVLCQAQEILFSDLGHAVLVTDSLLLGRGVFCMWVPGKTPTSSTAHQKIHLVFSRVASPMGRGMDKMTFPAPPEPSPYRGKMD